MRSRRKRRYGRRRWSRYGQALADFVFAFILGALEHTCRFAWQICKGIAMCIYRLIVHCRCSLMRKLGEPENTGQQRTKNCLGERRDNVDDATAALRTLGFPRTVAARQVACVMEDCEARWTAEDIVKAALHSQ